MLWSEEATSNLWIERNNCLNDKDCFKELQLIQGFAIIYTKKVALRAKE